MQSRRIKNISIFGILICSMMVVTACARHEIKLHAVSYNKAISDYGNKQVLLNAVRASKRYPMYFSAVGNMTGRGSSMEVSPVSFHSTSAPAGISSCAVSMSTRLQTCAPA